MARTSDYRLEPKSWPPPEDRKSSSRHLFGFDDGYQPYIVKYEKEKKHEGWVACTLSEYASGTGTAIPRQYVDEDVEEIIKYWSDTPLLLKSVFENMHDDGGRILRYE